MRLGFAVAINVDPDILLTDEVLAVGDEAFQRKCLEHIAILRKRGVTIVYVSHALELGASALPESDLARPRTNRGRRTIRRRHRPLS